MKKDKKHYKAILFDLDGTLLPMDMGIFVNEYLKLLAVKLAPFGISHEELVPAIWKSTEAMVKNDGSRSNEDAFWECFASILGKGKELLNESCLDFYAHEFNEARIFSSPNPLAREAVQIAADKTEQVILATNPLFPYCGQLSRLGWVGLTEADFAFITSYENESVCKPNPAYFLHVCERAGVAPQDCLMIGNDEREDMYAASSAGIDCYLVTDCLIPSEQHPWQGRRGSFAEMLEYLRQL